MNVLLALIDCSCSVEIKRVAYFGRTERMTVVRRTFFLLRIHERPTLSCRGKTSLIAMDIGEDAIGCCGLESTTRAGIRSTRTNSLTASIYTLAFLRRDDRHTGEASGSTNKQR